MLKKLTHPTSIRSAFWLCVVAVLVLSLMPPSVQLPSTGWDKTNHLLGFAVLAALGCLAWPSRTTRVLAGLLAYGALIECLQALTPYRFAEGADLLADALGLALGWALAFIAKPHLAADQTSGQ